MKRFDVIVVGGGLIGSAIAFELASKRLRVALIDRQQPGREASWAAAGMLSPGPDSLESLPLVPLGKESLRLYPEFVSAIEEESGKTVSYTGEGTFEFFDSPDESNELLSRYAELGLPAEVISNEFARAVEPELNPDANHLVWLPGEATVDPRLLIDATIAAAKSCGVEILAANPVSSVVVESGRCAGVIVSGQKISADKVVIAAGSFCGGIGEDAAEETNPLARYAPTEPVRGQMMALRSNRVKLRKVLRSERGYIVPRAGGRIIAGSTLEAAGFCRDTTPAGLRSIFEAAVALAPALAEAEVVETWAGLRPDTPDHLPIIGPTDITGLLIATGHYRNGILLAPATAKLICDWITEGRTTFDAGKFSPMRFSSTQPLRASANVAPANS